MRKNSNGKTFSTIQKFGLSIILWTMACTMSYAQEESMPSELFRNEITIGYGLKSLITLNGYSGKEFDWPLGNFHLQYLYNLNGHVGLGMLLDYTHSNVVTKEVIFDYDERGRFIGGHLNYIDNGTEWFTISPTIRIYWFNKKNVAMYSRFGVGVVFSTGYKNSAYIAPNISGVSIEVGGERLRFCTELLSIGTYGLFNGGIKYSF